MSLPYIDEVSRNGVELSLKGAVCGVKNDESIWVLNNRWTH